MTAEGFRIWITIVSVIWTVALVLFLTMTLILYRRINSIQILLKKTIEENKELLKPVAQVSAVLEVVRGGIDIVSRISKIGKGEERDG